MKGLERIIADLELELAGAEAVAHGIRGALTALRGEREPRMDREDARDVAASRKALAEPERVPWFPEAEAEAPQRHPPAPHPMRVLADEMLQAAVDELAPPAPKKRRGRPPKAKPAEPVLAEKPKRSKMVSHLCHKCNGRTEWDPCDRCGAKVPVVSSLATMAPDLAHADDSDV